MGVYCTCLPSMHALQIWLSDTGTRRHSVQRTASADGFYFSVPTILSRDSIICKDFLYWGLIA